ncbi:AI-2E family transporter [Metabacillus endolithicus]|uniref:AI-2E family transporter n=1 Tax=Metabacillus endolithicus TaxID=1535204 RepID=A0ABW5BZX1_9BACI|nr:AI-2E family transporter [Metabacillus endolithicus]UPG62587.1 AI-2E family transporter [Metabacillus endolithicus]
MNKKDNLIRVCQIVTLFFVVIYLGTKVSFIFQPFVLLIQVITVPLLLSVFFYYLINPVVGYLVRYRLNRTMAILLIYGVCLVVCFAFGAGIWPSLRMQIMNFITNVPSMFASLQAVLEGWEKSGLFAYIFPETTDTFPQLTESLNSGFVLLENYARELFEFVSNFAMVLIIFPIILFFMLKEGDKISTSLTNIVPIRFRTDMREVLTEIGNMLGGFIIGRVVVNLILGILMYIGFLIIGLPYGLLLTVFAVILNFIPIIGALVSTVPIVIVALSQSLSMALWAVLVIFIAQQIQDNLVGPYIFGKQLDIHPVTTIILVMVAAKLGGIITILISIPAYLILKIIVRRIYRLFYKVRWENL